MHSEETQPLRGEGASEWEGRAGVAVGVVRWGKEDWGMAGVIEKRLEGGGGEGEGGERAECGCGSGCVCDKLDRLAMQLC